MIDRLWHTNPSRRELQRFAIIIAVALSAVAAVQWWLEPSRGWNHALLLAALLIAGLGVVAPRVVRFAFQLWMAFGYVLGRIMTVVILAATYFLAFAFVGALLRVMRKDVLDRRAPRQRQISYWRVPERYSRERDCTPY